MRRFTFAPPPATAREIESLAREYGLTEPEVIEQLVELGLEEIDEEAPRVTE
jgi:hypothetical protein